MATIKDKIGLAMLPSAQSGGASTSETDFSGTVHSLLPIQHETPDLVDIIPNTTDVNTGGVYTDVTWISDHDFGIGDLLKVTFTLKGLSSTTRAWGYNEFYPKDNVTEYTDGTYTAYWDVISSASITRAFRFYQASSPRTGTISIDRVVKVVNGDFKFERSSSATRVGSDGYIKDVEVLSDELVQNEDFEEIGDEEITNGDFSNGENGWNPVAGNFDIINGKAVVNHTNDTSIIVQSNVSTVGKMYRVEFTISDYVDGRIRLRYPFINGDLENNPRNGTFVYYGEAIDHRFELQSRITEDANYKVDNISVKEVGENWTFQDGWSITDDGGDLKAVGDGTMTSADTLNHNYNFTDNSKYRFTFTISNHQNGSVYIREPFDGSADAVDEDGTHSFDYIVGTANEIRFRSNDGFTGNIDNISVKEVTDDTDIPRLDYSDGCPSLLLEPERANRITKSNEFSVFQNTEGSAISLTTLTNSPENKQNAYLHTPDTSNSYHRINSTTSGLINAPSGFTYTISLFVKPNGYDYFNIRTYGSAGSNFSNASFNLADGTVDFLSPNFDSSSVEEYGNGWYRVVLTTSPTSLGTVYLRPQPNSQTNDFISAYTGDGESGCFYYGMQVEQGSYPTSYIPTNGSTVTRLADVCNNAGDSTIFNDAEGVLFVDMALLENDGNNAISISDGTNSNRIFISYNALGRLDVNVLSGNTYQAIFNYTGVANTKAFNKIALKYKENDFALWVNGVEVVTDSSGITPLGLDRLNFAPASVITDNFFGKTRSLLYFNEALTDEELEALTTSNIDQVLKNYQTIGERLGATYESTHVKTKLNELF